MWLRAQLMKTYFLAELTVKVAKCFTFANVTVTASLSSDSAFCIHLPGTV